MWVQQRCPGQQSPRAEAPRAPFQIIISMAWKTKSSTKQSLHSPNFQHDQNSQNSQKSSQARTFLPQCFSDFKTALEFQLTKRTGFVETPGRRPQVSQDSWKARFSLQSCWLWEAALAGVSVPSTVKSERGGGPFGTERKHQPPSSTRSKSKTTQ